MLRYEFAGITREEEEEDHEEDERAERKEALKDIRLALDR
jgi:hypothetical protein